MLSSMELTADKAGCWQHSRGGGDGCCCSWFLCGLRHSGQNGWEINSSDRISVTDQAALMMPR